MVCWSSFSDIWKLGIRCSNILVIFVWLFFFTNAGISVRICTNLYRFARSAQHGTLDSAQSYQQLCFGQNCGIDHAIHSPQEFFENDESQAMLLFDAHNKAFHKVYGQFKPIINHG